MASTFAYCSTSDHCQFGYIVSETTIWLMYICIQQIDQFFLFLKSFLSCYNFFFFLGGGGGGGGVTELHMLFGWFFCVIEQIAGPNLAVIVQPYLNNFRHSISNETMMIYLKSIRNKVHKKKHL